MQKRENINFIASVHAPNPREVSYWIDLKSDENGNIIRSYNPTTKKWLPINKQTNADQWEHIKELTEAVGFEYDKEDHVISMPDLSGNNWFKGSTVIDAIKNGDKAAHAALEKEIQDRHTADEELENRIHDYYDPITTDLSNRIDEANNTADSALNKADQAITTVGTLTTKVNDLDNEVDLLKYSTVKGMVLETTHAELLSLYNQSALIPGQLYGITNYTCAYLHPSSGSDQVYQMQAETTDVKMIVLRATAVDKFDDEVQYIRKEGYVPIIKCLYEIDPEKVSFTKGMTTYHPTGAVYYMEDAYQNAASYDFKHIKFKRYKINNITPNMQMNDGTGGTHGCYRCLTGRTTSYKLSDERMRTGAGAAEELTMIPKIFSGEWRGANADFTELQGLTPFHADYIKDVIKPYTREDYPMDSYLAWQIDNNEAGGLSAASSTGYAQMVGQCNVDVTPSDFVYRYTFDYNGEDASERLLYGSTNRPLISNARIIARGGGYKGYDGVKLPNTVIALSESCINSASTGIKNLLIDGEFSGGNTILMRSYNPAQNYASIMNTTIKGIQGFQRNLIITRQFNYSNFGHIGGCYINGAITGVTGDKITNSVWFGFYSGLDFLDCTRVLFFGTESTVKLQGDTAYKSPADGEYWYNTQWQDWFGYSIMGPCQYCHFAPHFNCNTFRAVYNKGVTVDAANQGNSYGELKWGTHLHYNIGQNIKFGAICKSDIRNGAFNESQIIKNQSGVEIFNDDARQLPNMWNVRVLSNYANPATIRNIEGPGLTYIASNNAGARGGVTYDLYTDTTGNWHIGCPYIGEITAANTLSLDEGITTMSLEDEDMAYQSLINDYDYVRMQEEADKPAEIF